MTTRGLITLAAGGTGGHLFPAQALAEELVRRGYVVHLMSDERVQQYGAKFPAADIHVIPSATVTIKKPWTWPASLLRLMAGYRKAHSILDQTRPLAVTGFGGYPSLPPLAAATRLGIATLIHEQNAVMGRANRIMAKRVDVIASSFPDIVNLDDRLKDKLVMTGNPVRDLVLDVAGAPYVAPKPDETFNLLVFGGSQGARFFSDMMPGVFAAMADAARRRLKVVQQCRPEDIERVRKAYEDMGLDCELQSFFAGMPRRIADAHLVIGRSGASTIAELGVIGRPAILVPLPHALDNDQLRNAQSFSAAGAGWLKPQGDIVADELAAFLTRLMYRPEELSAAAAAALGHGHADAAERLAGVIEQTIAQHGAKG
ncbi:MAG TPA: undecaprenyldiphospho-muramoylpentapeptide beta-N-acetylglucosaminyltransferase, partial [Rhizobiales bacterium]|nr:undecaprenyldiphospho-muramoylpentapeptide beta-N-acetylglucosaminyltransferase [Hyphomicrobiales bacterium]